MYYQTVCPTCGPTDRISRVQQVVRRAGSRYLVIAIRCAGCGRKEQAEYPLEVSHEILPAQHICGPEQLPLKGV